MGLRRNLRRRGATLAGLLVASTAISLCSARMAMAGRSYQCQHPTVTGQEATDLKNVSPATACKAVRQLARLVKNGERGGRLYRCVGLTRSHPGKPVLVIHSLGAWQLRISHEYEFVMSRGRSSFVVIGTDFPLNCT